VFVQGLIIITEAAKQATLQHEVPAFASLFQNSVELAGQIGNAPEALVNLVNDMALVAGIYGSQTPNDDAPEISPLYVAALGYFGTALQQFSSSSSVTWDLNQTQTMVVVQLGRVAQTMVTTRAAVQSVLSKLRQVESAVDANSFPGFMLRMLVADVQIQSFLDNLPPGMGPTGTDPFNYHIGYQKACFLLINIWRNIPVPQPRSNVLGAPDLSKADCDTASVHSGTGVLTSNTCGDTSCSYPGGSSLKIRRAITATIAQTGDGDCM